MTEHPYPDHHFRPSDPSSAPPRVTSIGELIAAVPALLGFVPERSLVLACMTTDSLAATRRTTLHMVMRQDLPTGRGADYDGVTREVAERCAMVCERDGLDTVVAVLVTGKHSKRGMDDVARTVFDTLAERGVEMIGAHVIARIATGERWTSLGNDPRSGVLSDPTSSAVAASSVLRGRQIRSSREDIARALTLVDADAQDRFHDRLDVVVDDIADMSEPELLAAAMDRITAVHRSGRVDDDGAALILMALCHKPVRDALMSVADTEMCDSADSVWAFLTCRLAGPERAPAAFMLGFWAYVRGDGPTAAVALELALEAYPGYSFAELLDSGLQNGIPPNVMRQIAIDARDLAEDLGTTMPPPAHR